MEDIDPLGFCSSSYFPFSNDKNDEYSNIENLLTSDTIERGDTTNYGHKQDKKSSKKYTSKTNSHNADSERNIPQINLEKKKKQGDISKIANPFMSARQVSLQPLTEEQSEEMDECDMASSSEDECRNQKLALEDDMPCKLISEFPAEETNHQKDSDKKINCKDKETKVSKIKPVFGKPSKKFDDSSKQSKLTKDSVADIKSLSKKHKSLPSDIDIDGPKSISDPNQCVITDEDEDSFCLSAKVCSQAPSQKNNEEGEQIVPNFSRKKKKSKSKDLEESPHLKMHTASVLESSKNSGSKKLKKKRSLAEISSAILNSDHHHKKDKDSNKDKDSSEKRSQEKEKKKKLKNSTEKSNNCSITTENDQSFSQVIEKACNIPKKKRKKSKDNSLFANEYEVENNGPVIINIRSLADNSDLNQDSVETLCPCQNDDQPTPESSDSTDHQEHKNKKKKKKSKEENTKEECESYEKPVKKHKKKKKDSDRNKNVKVEKMPPEMVLSFKESEDEETVHISEEVKDPNSDNEEAKVVSSERKMESKSLEKCKQEKQFSVKKKDDQSKKRDDQGKKKDDQDKKKDDQAKKKNGTKHQEKHSKEKSKNKCRSSENTKVPCKKLCMQKREILDTGTWVQCTNSECLKWRFLHDVQDPITIPMLWTCEMNSDPKQNDCSYPEIMPLNKDNEEFIYTKYTEGTIVWARVDGYPWWPAMVEMDPDSLSYFDIETEDSMYPKYYHVVFFGKKVSRAWVTLSNIAAFTENKPPPVSKGTPRIRTQEFNAAEKLAAKALDIPINDRLKVFSFSNRYKGSWADCTCKACLRATHIHDQDKEEDI